MAFVPFVFHERALLPHVEGMRIVEAACLGQCWYVASAQRERRRCG